MADDSTFQVDDIKVGCACEQDNNGWEIEHIDKDWIRKSGISPPPNANGGAPGETRTPTS
ncbi:MAG: hypothetical protein LBJ92_02770 [Holosporales bacterium]|nr:hypothetical protein [Holosporales bacterium]